MSVLKTLAASKSASSGGGVEPTHFLSKSTNSEFILLQNAVSFLTTDTWKITYDFAMSGNSSSLLTLTGLDVSSGVTVRRSDGLFLYRFLGDVDDRYENALPTVENQRILVEYEKASTGTAATTLHVDSVEKSGGANSSDFGSFSFEHLFRNSGLGRLYRITIEKNGTIIHDWYSTTGTGSTLVDHVGGNDGTLTNFPTDNSQWVQI